MDEEAPPTELAPTIQRRRRHSRSFKAQVLAECAQPGASIAGVAVRHGLNPNLVHTWRRAKISAEQQDFIRLPTPVSTLAVAAPATVKLEVPTPRGTLVVHWPLAEMSQAVTWLRALTR